MRHWHCISGCGACCRLDPAERSEDLAALTPAQQRAYLALVGPDGWCIHFDTGSRRCRIYAERPDFCRVENLWSLFGSPDADGAEAPQHPSAPDVATTPAGTPAGGNPAAAPVDECPVDESPAGEIDADRAARAEALAIQSCRHQIRAEYGGRGRVMRRFERAIRRP
jgi:hypothetical protein